MTIEEFVKMWEADNAVEQMLLIEERKHRDGVMDHLYHVFYRNYRGNNGRHEALRVRISKLREVVNHEIFNLHGEDWGKKDAVLDADNNQLNYSVQINTWFNQWSTGYSTSAGTTGAVTIDSGTTSSTGGYFITV